jgi:type IV pilus assembly protein PilA
MCDLNKSGATRRMQNPQAGFSLIELLIVVAVILIIAAIAIPNFLRAKISAHESSAVSSLRSINTAEATYNTTYGAGYGSLAQLSTPGIPCAPTPATACLIDPNLSTGAKSGYNFTAIGLNANNIDFVAAATPIAVGATGQRTFCVDETGVIHADPTGGVPPADDVGCQALPVLQ